MNFDMFVSREAESLPAGSTRRLHCPACHETDGGKTTFVVGREPNRVWFKCFRASCGVSGIVGSANLAPAIAAEVSRAVARIRPYRDPIMPLSASTGDVVYFRERFEIDPHMDIFTTIHDEYILPVRGPNFDLRGHVQRQPVWKGEPRAPRTGRTWDPDANEGKGGPMVKTKVFPVSTAPLLAWYSPAKDNLIGQELRRELVVVEDQLSAIKCAQAGVPSVALLGNGMNIEMVRDIVKVRPHCVTIALDPGAEGQAQSLAKKFGLYFRRTRVVALEADPKDLLIRDLLEELGL